MPKNIELSVHLEEWATRIPFRIAGSSCSAFKAAVVELSDGKYTGRGEGLPVFYLGETVETIQSQIESVAEHIERGVGKAALHELMPPGGARNAVDSALWDLEAKASRRSIWELTGIQPRSLTTVFTIGLEDTPQAMAARAVEASIYPTLKIKLDRDRPVERITAIRAARPDARLVVDANQDWTYEQLVEVAPKLAGLGVKLIEQPLRRGEDEALENFASPVPLSADESCQHRGELEEIRGRYQVINIKLDKAGGLTEALRTVDEVHERGLRSIVSNMGGTSLSMAPAFVLGQLCHYVELDGHLLLKHDRIPNLPCDHGQIGIPDPRLWG